MADSPEEIKKSIKLYTIVGLILFGCTVLTVAVATVPALDIGQHGFDIKDAILGLLIAAFKASCVAFIFMHLNHEKKMIYWIFFGALCFGVILILLFGYAFYDPITFDALMPNFGKG